MSNCAENFSAYSTYYYPTPMTQYQYPVPMVARSPDLAMNQGTFSPLCRPQVPTFAYQRECAGSPLISLQPCANPGEESMEVSSAQEKQLGNTRLALRSKLSFKSKVFVKKNSISKNDRKASQDTKAHSEDEGFTSDDADDVTKIPEIVSFSKSKSYAVRKLYAPPATKFTSLEDKTPKSFQVKYKTELCKNWQAGECKFGSKCSFAHGVEELTEKKHLPSNYKTKICKQFHEELYCPYGARCQFIHLEDCGEKEQSELTKAIYGLAGVRAPRKSLNRLSIFNQLSS